MDLYLNTFFWMSILAASVRIAAPILLASLGEVVAEKAGFLNLGIEGMMTVGAWAAFMGAFYTGSPWLGILIGALGGGLVAGLAAYICVTRGADQIVTGIVINLFCLGLTSLTYKKIFEATRQLPSIESFQAFRVPGLSEIPFLGPVLFRHIPLVYVALLLVPVFGIFLSRTTLGLKIRAVGEYPRAADTAGINVHATRYFAVIVGGTMAGLAGGTLSVGQLNIFMDFMTAGRGFIALAVVVFAKWAPLRVLGASLLFGFADALQFRFQALGVGIPHEFLLMIPYILTIVVLAGLVGKASYPAAICLPYLKEKRRKPAPLLKT